MEVVTKFISAFLYSSLVSCLAAFVGIVIAHFLCNINAQETYSGLSGFWHGLFIVPNLVRHFFDSTILYKAESNTSSYNVLWWIAFITQIPGLFLVFIRPIISPFIVISEDL